jgi:KDO2-lipid IV(A) lauroyltransferase
MTIPPELRAPRHWPSWLLVGFLWLLVRLPWNLQRRIGAGIGWLLFRLLQRRANDTRINLRLCFPEKSEHERELMARDVFRNAGIGVMETFNAWFRPVEYFQDKVSFEGLEHLQAMQALGRGALMVGGHYSTMDVMAPLAAQKITVDMIYRPQKNPVIDFMFHHGRGNSQGRLIAHQNTRELLQTLRQNRIIWYPVDHDNGIQHSVFAPFFGVPAATLNTPSRLTKGNNNPVIMIHCRRVGDAQHYVIHFTPMLENFPGKDDVADATLINTELEKIIRLAPTQYMWFHRRFKNRPPGEKSPYLPKPKEVRRQKAAAAAAREAQKNT